MVVNLRLAALTLSTVFLMSSCERAAAPQVPSAAALPAQAAVSAPSAAPASTDQWLGKWIGPEGTLLLLSKNADAYVVQIQSLDGPNTYVGKAAGDRIEFERNGKTESIHAATGLETGMKWLAEKKDCLMIQTSEGFCRD